MHQRIAVAAALSIVLAACQEKEGTITPTKGPITESVYASGIVKADGQYQVFPTVNGTVIALLVSEGDTVKAGQALLQIDDRSSGLTERNADAQLRLLEQNASDQGPVLAQLRSAIAQARDKLTVDSTNYSRQQRLAEQGVGSKSELEQRELAYTTSRSGYDRAVKALSENRERLRTELELARNNRAISAAGNSDRTPRSLIDGLVYDLLIEPGELATTQRPVAVIGSATDLYLELEVDEYDIRELKPGQQAFVSLDSYAGKAFEARIARVIPYMDERSRTFRVEAEFVDRPPTLYPNLTVEASIVIRRKEDALTIPAAYVVEGKYVLTGPDERTPVTIGVKDMEKVEVLEGIDAGTQLYKP
ncbi:MAG: efflux RND transporter periplasmic adaptor subunit [Flavobacteriales bacterium]|nr:efflux RND transporter periplasmic adaptor subunit [Flavobacteriales bacterium]